MDGWMSEWGFTYFDANRQSRVERAYRERRSPEEYEDESRTFEQREVMQVAGETCTNCDD